MSLLLKEERVAECLMSCGRLFQRWGPKCEKNTKDMGFAVKALEFEHADEERRVREGT